MGGNSGRAAGSCGASCRRRGPRAHGRRRRDRGVGHRARRTQILDTTVRGHATLAAGHRGAPPRRPAHPSRARRAASPTSGCSRTPTSPIATSRASRSRSATSTCATSPRPVPRSSDGRAEACLWIGDTGTVRARAAARLRVVRAVDGNRHPRRDASSDIDVDGDAAPASTSSTSPPTARSARLRIGPDVADRSAGRVGRRRRWDSRPGERRQRDRGQPASRATLAGVYLDEGTTRTTVRATARSRARRGRRSATTAARATPSYGNDYRGIAPGAQPVSRDHLTTFREG